MDVPPLTDVHRPELEISLWSHAMPSLLRTLCLTSLLLAGCAHRGARIPDTSPTPLSSAELAFIDGLPPDAPFDMVLDDTPQGELSLRAPSLALTVDSPGLDRLEDRMRATLLREEGVGLAAPQVGVQRRVILVQRQDRDGDPVELYVNPRVSWFSEQVELGWEGCLSVPAGFGQVERPTGISVQYDQSDGQRIEEAVEGWTARIFQHEIDHLDGVLFLDRTVTDPLLPKDEYLAMRERERLEAEQQQTTDTGAE